MDSWSNCLQLFDSQKYSRFYKKIVATVILNVTLLKSCDWKKVFDPLTTGWSNLNQIYELCYLHRHINNLLIKLGI